MIPRLGDGNFSTMISGLVFSIFFRLENDSPSRGRKRCVVDSSVCSLILRLENDSPSRGRKLLAHLNTASSLGCCLKFRK